MKINWKVRFRNKAWLVAFLTVSVTAVYNILSLIGVFPGVSEDTVTQILMLLVKVLVMLGIVIDPTTEGVGDSDRAMSYTEPGKTGGDTGKEE